jgi:hypothetical protein
MSIAVFVCGGVIIDNVVAADGALARDLVGGNAVYAAMGASHWLDQVGIVARVPRTYPADAFTALHGSGLDLGGLVVEPVDVTRSEWFFHRADGSRVDHLHATAEQADAFGMTGERVPIEQAQRFQTRLEQATEAGGDYKTFRAAHPVTADQVPTGYWRARGVHLAPNAPAAQLTLARQARRQGLTVTCDPGFHAGSMRADDLDELLALVDAFLPSERELTALCPGRDAAAALSHLSGRARALVGVKLGSKGALVLLKGETAACHVPAVAARPLDPTGAGDAFCGGFLAGLVRGEDAFAAGLRGAVSAALAIEGMGALQLRDRRAEARLRLRQAAASSGDLPKAHNQHHPPHHS